ncbi:phage tail protein [Azospirillum sp. RWY-5-1]|uniref:Phage tail protein n=1 Tax=Azospirillum oleiclasticum TaxID=2735135 RepID=A0ABX2TI39_9PROT|nr:tail fiber protein [Azospirillum oleiclasticum]NYZ16455.1 phage tail protein [Azospirillum oleiclasticum]NYZ23829.1 phage tail protein [Azospirillum oleiclasticum]
MDPFIGEIRIFAFDYAPQDWAYCNGGSLPVAQNQALYSLIGPVYGTTGSPPTAFNVPNLQSQVPMGAATMVDGTYTALNQSSGAEKVMLNLSQLPSHTHTMGGETFGQATGQTNTPSATTLPNLVIVNSKASTSFSNAAPNTYFSPNAISGVGGNGTHENRQPFLAMNFCICTDGIYPSFP